MNTLDFINSDNISIVMHLYNILSLDNVLFIFTYLDNTHLYFLCTYITHLPDSATSSTVKPCLFAIKPNTEKMTNPARKLVNVLAIANRRLSLEKEKNEEKKYTD